MFTGTANDQFAKDVIQGEFVGTIEHVVPTDHTFRLVRR